MALVELIQNRGATSKTFEDNQNPNVFTFTSSQAVIHYESTPGSNVFDSEIDMTPTRVNNAVMDGWVINNNGWHYALGKSKTGILDNADGVVGFGGRSGQNWFYFRLVNAGYLYVPSGSPALATNFTAIGGNPTYNRANLSSAQNTRNIGGSVINIESVAEWHNLWTTPGSGEVYARWRSTGNSLKEEIVINQAARTWITNNAAPVTPANQTYFGFVFKIDMSDIPGRFINDVIQQQDDDFNDSQGPVELRNNLNELLAFMPLDYVIVRTLVNTGRVQTDESPVMEIQETKIRLRKRFWKDADGSNYLSVGALSSDIANMPDGDLIFDPTFNTAISASTDDAIINDSAYDDSSTTMLIGGVGVGPLVNYGEGFRFTNVTIPQGATVSSCKLSLTSNGGWLTVLHRWTAINQDNTATFSSGSPPGSRPIVGTIAIENLNDNHIAGTAYDYPIDPGVQATLGTAVQSVFARGGWVSGNALAIVNNSDQDASAWEDYSREIIRTYDYSPAVAPAITIVYTGGGGGAGKKVMTMGFG